MKKISIIAVIAFLVVIGCGNGKEAKGIDQQTMDKVAKIAAMVEIDEAKAVLMLEAEEMNLDQYKALVTKITLDPAETKKFIEMKNAYLVQYKK